MVEPGGDITFYAHVGGDEKDDSNVAFIPLMGYRQSPDLPIVYAHIEAGSQKSYHLSVKAPDTEGPLELLLLHVEDPYEALHLAEDSGYTAQRPKIRSSNRVVIRVAEQPWPIQ